MQMGLVNIIVIIFISLSFSFSLALRITYLAPALRANEKIYFVKSFASIQPPNVPAITL